MTSENWSPVYYQHWFDLSNNLNNVINCFFHPAGKYKNGAAKRALRGIFSKRKPVYAIIIWTLNKLFLITTNLILIKTDVKNRPFFYIAAWMN